MTPKDHGLLRGLTGMCLGLIVLVLAVSAAAASPPAQSVGDGEAVFKANCNQCHTIGGGDRDGPDLKGVTLVHDQQWLDNFITDPAAVIASGDTAAFALFKKYNFMTMPKLDISQEQVLSVIRFLGSPAALTTASATTTAATTPSAAGDPKNGRALFVNDVRLANGGPACISCHSIDNVGLLGGGAFGPNLTQASVKYGDAGLAAALLNIPFPTMLPIFANHPLTPGEVADLSAFIISAAGQPQVNREGAVLLLSAAGFVAAMGVAAVYWRGRLRGVRRELVERANSRGSKK